MTEQTLQDRLRRAKLVEEYNDQMFDEAAAAIDTLMAEVARLKAALERIEKIDGVAHNYISCYDCRESSMIARAALAHGEAD